MHQLPIDDINDSLQSKRFQSSSCSFFALSRRTHVETLAMQATSMSNQCHRLLIDYKEFSMTNQLITQ